jgi:hypothetical protein
MGETRETRAIHLIKRAISVWHKPSHLAKLIFDADIAELEKLGVTEDEAAALCPDLLTTKLERHHNRDFDMITDEKLLWQAYCGLLVLSTICRKAKLSGGAETADAIIKDIGDRYPRFPARTALRKNIILSPEERQEEP